MNPKARSENLALEETEDGLVIYDLDRDTVHALNETTTLIFKACDGQTPADELTSVLPAGIPRTAALATVRLALRQLTTAHLVSDAAEDRNVSRRECLAALRSSGAIAFLAVPVIRTILAPTPAHALSGTPAGCVSQCCGSPFVTVCVELMCNCPNGQFLLLRRNCNARPPGLCGGTTRDPVGDCRNVCFGFQPARVTFVCHT